MPCCASAACGKLENLGRDVSCQHIPVRADPGCCLQGLIAGTRRDIEYPAAWSNLGHVKHDLSGRPKPCAQERTPIIPGLRSGLPLLARGYLVLGGIERRHSASPSCSFDPMVSSASRSEIPPITGE